MAETVDFRETVRGDYYRERAKDDASRQTMLEWSDLVPERGSKLAFRYFPYQREWHSEEVARAREVVWMKAAQVGMSAYAWRWGARRCDSFGDRVIYFFPTDVHVREFGDTRMEPSIRASDYLLGRIPPSHVHQKGLKQIGAGFLSLRGLHSSLAVQSVDADALVFDEYDLSDLTNLGQAERRITGAPRRRGATRGSGGSATRRSRTRGSTLVSSGRRSGAGT